MRLKVRPPRRMAVTAKRGSINHASTPTTSARPVCRGDWRARSPHRALLESVTGAVIGNPRKAHQKACAHIDDRQPRIPWLEGKSR